MSFRRSAGVQLDALSQGLSRYPSTPERPGGHGGDPTLQCGKDAAGQWETRQVWPGEISLANHGVLLWMNCPRPMFEALRQPLGDRRVTVTSERKHGLSRGSQSGRVNESLSVWLSR
ncbi:hypothetical protein CEB3_c26910 [Peptococcaceae bacterium CEB3]|nr:hypothetical protein CEB3_c26910 [Peptococcaceae bacterium CEB3]